MTSERVDGPPVPDRAITDDAALAVALAAGAAQVLVALRERADAGEAPRAGTELGKAGDAAAQRWLADALAATRPYDAVLSEEAEGDASRLGAARVWIIDPLDGTREFGEIDPDGTRRTDFAVHVALWASGAGLVAGAVALPGRGIVLDSAGVLPVSDADARAVLEGRRPLRIAASRTRPPAIVGRLAERADVDLVPMGSNGVKVVAVVEGRADAYIHAGGQYEWDSAAPVAVARAAGLIATRLDGSALAYNKPDPWSPDLVVCHPALVAHVHRLLAEAGPDDAPGASA
ncbi:MAG TPA: inositol monophosphatase family protein [Candidatus Limnocylindrales bacterium]|nr:inositol monophosphatase family protein [Candidatus Limnocylindrales bacterium]